MCSGTPWFKIDQFAWDKTQVLRSVFPMYKLTLTFNFAVSPLGIRESLTTFPLQHRAPNSLLFGLGPPCRSGSELDFYNPQMHLRRRVPPSVSSGSEIPPARHVYPTLYPTATKFSASTLPAPLTSAIFLFVLGEADNSTASVYRALRFDVFLQLHGAFI